MHCEIHRVLLWNKKFFEDYSVFSPLFVGVYCQGVVSLWRILKYGLVNVNHSWKSFEKMAKKKIILTNWDDSQRIGVAVESFEELKFKGNQDT